MSTPQDHFDAARKFQAYYDETLRKVGMRAPQPVLNQTVNDYRRETLRTLKRMFLTNHELGQINCRGLKADALAVFEPQLLAAAVTEAFNPANVPEGQLREIITRDERNGQEIHRFIGQHSFVRDMMIPGRRARIWDDHSKSWFPPQSSRRVA
jgi:hypothetical protein